MFRVIVLCVLSLISTIAYSQTYSISLSDKQITELGDLIWKNEGQGKRRHLTVWNRGENFPSLGIGHFIWYPQQQKGPFKEQFPALLSYFENHGVVLPAWIKQTETAPWKSREQFYKAFDDQQLSGLRALLSEHLNLQVRFIILRLENAIPQILNTCDTEQKKIITANLSHLTATSAGLFALLDYINFKGEGLSEKERYQDQGWGLKQVLLTMPKVYKNPLRAFGLAADEVLTRRVKNAPRDESHWLKGWRTRVYGYQYIMLD